MQEETDGALLYYMSCREGDAERTVSDAAAREFHRRYAAALVARCRRICQALGASGHDAADLASCTLAKAVEKAGTFVDQPGATGRGRRTLSWLQQIARNLLVDCLRNPNRPGPITGAQDEIPIEDYSDPEFASLLCDGKSLARDRRTIQLVKEALPTLDERTRTVLVYTVLQRQRSPGRSYMYRGSAEALAQRLGTTVANVRRIRRLGIRALADRVRERSE
ncbi:MAG TPA: sigma-70 family RNA polymerase sigma factor [Steroidobacteraceae bacterium]|jgi:RNA polymerase sigma factor (sigma-70 family)|nr:sigma-70 family RNA polymerase sigma factor [Steroidobacteraceae bacterium]